MISQAFIKISIVVAITIICVIAVFYLFIRLDTAKGRENFDIYSLVPQNATTVFETDLFSELTANIDSMDSSKSNITLHVSELLELLKDYITTDDDKHIDKVLLSFHGRDTKTNQILYCKLSSGGHKFAKSFIRAHASQEFMPKHSEYRGHDIIVYPVDAGRFLTVLLTNDFLVASFQKRLVERAIDAYSENKSLLQSPTFIKIYTNEKRNAEAMLYVNIDSIKAAGNDNITKLKGWGEFDLKFRKDAIICSGKVYPADSVSNRLIGMSKMEVNKIIPASTTLYCQWNISNKSDLQAYANKPVDTNSNTEEYNKRAWGLLKDHAGDYMSFYLLTKKEVQEQTPHAVAVLPLTDERGAQRNLRSWLRNASIRKRKQLPQGTCSVFVNQYKSINTEKYIVPKDSGFLHIPCIDDADSIHICFFEKALLIARDKRSIDAYTTAVENDSNNILLQKAEAYLPTRHAFMLLADMERLLYHPESYTCHPIPMHFLKQHAEFFRHFILGMQVTPTHEEAASFNLVLLYKY